MQRAKKKDVLIPVLIITVLLWLAGAVFFIISSGRADAEREAREKLIANADSALETLYQTKQAEVNAANAASDAAYQDQLSAYVAQLRSGYQQAVVWNRDSKGINPTDGHFGKRKDAFFDLDVNLSYKAFFKNDQKLFVQLLGYNLYDFCTGLTEFTFEEAGEAHRYAMTLCSPRGLMVNLKYEF